MSQSNDLIDEKTVLHFGKYKDCKAGFIAKLNPRYLLWAAKNVQSFTLSEGLKAAISRELRNREVRQNAWAWGCFSRADYSDMEGSL